MKKLIYEIFEEVEERASRKDKIAVLRYNNNIALRTILQATFHPDIVFSVSAIPAYRPSDAPIGLGYISIDQELGRLYLFERNNPKYNPALTEKRKTEILIQILEAMEHKEAKVFENMLLKKQPAKGLTYALVKEAFPGLIP
jgi:hypothetical protein